MTVHFIYYVQIMKIKFLFSILSIVSLTIS